MANAEPRGDSQPSVKDQASDLVQDIKSEVKHEARQIDASNRPVDSTQTDVVVRRHVGGLSIAFFVAIALVLIAAMLGILIYSHTQH